MTNLPRNGFLQLLWQNKRYITNQVDDDKDASLHSACHGTRSDSIAVLNFGETGEFAVLNFGETGESYILSYK